MNPLILMEILCWQDNFRVAVDVFLLWVVIYALSLIVKWSGIAYVPSRKQRNRYSGNCVDKKWLSIRKDDNWILNSIYRSMISKYQIFYGYIYILQSYV